jgi:hypothetical protein
MNSTRRGAPDPVAPELMMLVICPNPDEDVLPDGLE